MSDELFASAGRRRSTRGGETCCVPNCYNNTREDRGLTFYTFPRDSSKRDVWIQAIRRPILWKPSTYHKVCANHFVGGRKTEQVSCPTVFPGRMTVEPRKRRSLKRLRPESSTETPVILSNADAFVKLPVFFQPESLRCLALKCYRSHLETQNTEIATLRDTIREKEGEIDKLQKLISKQTLSIEQFLAVDDSEMFRYYTGLPDYKTFCIIYDNLLAEVAYNILYIGSIYSEKAVTS